MKFCAPLSLISGGETERISVTTRRRRDVWLYVPGEEFPTRRVSDDGRSADRRRVRERVLQNHHLRTSLTTFLSPLRTSSFHPVPPPCFFIRRTRSVLVSTCKWLSRTRVPLILLLYILERYKNGTRTRARLIGSRPSRKRTRTTGSE